MKAMHMSGLTSNWKSSSWDKWLFFIVILLAGIGLLAVYESSASIALRDFSNQYYYVLEQLKWYCLGVPFMLVLSKVYYRRLFPLAVPIFFLSLVFLFLVFLPYIGVKTYGAYRWVNFGFINFQPAEFVKLSLILYLAAWFSYPERRKLGAFLLIIGITVGLILLEPDLGTAIVILTIALLMYFFSGAEMIQFLYLLPVLTALIIGVALLAPYRVARFMTFFNPQSDPLGSSYQIRQILISLGSGGWLGVGIGKSRQKYAYLPEANTDSIFAIIGEEVGFVGGLAVISLFFLLLLRGFRIARACKDPFGRYLALGITSWIGIQVCINLGSVVALLPLTGIPLPFISYGGSSLIVLFTAIGILLSVSRYS